ncbi:gag-pol [Trichonephila clavipes]|nr:gag-pol [Trichonephila clavipes]
MQDLIVQRQNQRRRSIMCWGVESRNLRSNCSRNNKEDRSTKCWGCGGAGHLRNNCPRVNQNDPHLSNIIESKKVCSHKKGSGDGNIEAPSRRPCTENSKYSWRVEKKFGMIGPVVRQVTTPSTSESDPWSDESVRPLLRSSDCNNNILDVMDYFTKWHEAYLIADQEASTVAEVLVKHWFSRFRDSTTALQLREKLRFCSLQETV